MMGYELVDLDDDEALAGLAAMRPRRYPIQPQQLLIADALNAAGYDEFVVEIMRRASKTTTIFCWLLGRCASRPDYLVTFSAQSGVKGTARLREWKTRLDKVCPDPESDLPPWKRGTTRVTKQVQRHASLFGDDDLTASAGPETRGFKIMMGEVGKGIYFDNGSQFLVFKPDADAYRGEAGDISWVDEAQELEPEEGATFLAGIVPLQDTRGEGAAIVVSGTAGEVRAGPFWERVKRLRDQDPTIGGLDYCFPEDTPWELIEDEDAAIALLLTVHPGIGTLTTEDKMRKNWRKLERPKWAREYGSMWPETFGTVVVDPDLWAAGFLVKEPKIPTRVAYGWSIKPNGAISAIAVAWRTPMGLAFFRTVDHRIGTDWLPRVAQAVSIKSRGSTVGYDDIGQGKATAIECDALRPRPRLQPIPFSKMAAGCIQILREIERGTARHLEADTSLNNAAALVAKREIRGENGMFLFTPSEPGGDITTFDACARALVNYDLHFARRQGGGTTPIMGD